MTTKPTIFERIRAGLWLAMAVLILSALVRWYIWGAVVLFMSDIIMFVLGVVFYPLAIGFGIYRDLLVWGILQ